jgi:hypothetical protein
VTTYVFLGPSLPAEQARRLLDATYLPPIQQGDLLRLLHLNPRRIGIVDGYFETVPAVWHKEILLAMSRGIHVFGAASMGALRAAELHSFGMIGIGTVFEWYRDGKITADDEVAVRHGPAELGYLALGQALVDIRDSCSAALQAGLIGEALATRLVDAARQLPYWERSYEAVAATVRNGEPSMNDVDTWLAFAKSHCTSLKARDAAALLTAMAEHIREPWVPKRVDFVFERTIFVERLINDIALAKAWDDGASPTPSAAPGHDETALSDIRRETLLGIAARRWAEQLGLEPSPDELEEEASAFCARLGLTDPTSVRNWLKRHSMTEQIFWTYMRDELLVGRLARKYQVDVDRELPDRLRMSLALRRSVSSDDGDET